MAIYPFIQDLEICNFWNLRNCFQIKSDRPLLQEVLNHSVAVRQQKDSCLVISAI